jgi:hypothetical protein
MEQEVKPKPGDQLGWPTPRKVVQVELEDP